MHEHVVHFENNLTTFFYSPTHAYIGFESSVTKNSTMVQSIDALTSVARLWTDRVSIPKIKRKKSETDFLIIRFNFYFSIYYKSSAQLIKFKIYKFLVFHD